MKTTKMKCQTPEIKIWNDMDISLHKLTTTLESLEKKKCTCGVMEFDMGEISHPLYGSAHIKGSLPLLLSEREFKPATKESADLVFNIISDWLVNNELKMGVEDDVAEKVIRYGINFISAVTPGEFGSPMKTAAVVLASIGAYFDDIMEEIGFTEEGDEDFTTMLALFGVVPEILSGKYESVQDLPEMPFPVLQPILWLLFLATEQATAENKDLSLHCNHVIDSILQTTKMMMLMPNLSKVCSEGTLIYFRQYEAGYLTILETIALMNGGVKNVTEEIRSNPVFQRMVTNFQVSTALTNDLLGVRREIGQGQEYHPGNSVLMKVINSNYKISLEQAMGETIRMIEVEMKDFIVLSQKLTTELYPENEDLVKYIEHMKYFIDGNIHAFEEQFMGERYGHTRFTPKYYKLNV